MPEKELLKEWKQNLKDGWKNILWNTVAPFRGAVRLWREGEKKGAAIAGAVELAFALLSIFSVKEQGWVSAGSICLMGNVLTNWGADIILPGKKPIAK